MQYSYSYDFYIIMMCLYGFSFSMKQVLEHTNVFYEYIALSAKMFASLVLVTVKQK